MVIKALQIAYPNQMKQIDTKLMASMWNKQLINEQFKNVNDFINDWISKEKFMPTIADVKQSILQKQCLDYTNPWYKHFTHSGIIEYNDCDVEWATYDDWKLLPKEMEKRMKYVPNNRDEKRIKVIKQAIELQERLRNGFTG